MFASMYNMNITQEPGFNWSVTPAHLLLTHGVVQEAWSYELVSSDHRDDQHRTEVRALPSHGHVCRVGFYALRWVLCLYHNHAPVPPQSREVPISGVASRFSVRLGSAFPLHLLSVKLMLVCQPDAFYHFQYSGYLDRLIVWLVSRLRWTERFAFCCLIFRLWATFPTTLLKPTR